LPLLKLYMEDLKDYNSYRPGDKKPAGSPYMPLLYTMLIAFGILLGMTLAHITSDKKGPLSYGKYNKLEDVMSFIKLKYVDTVNTDQLTETAIEKMLASLDPHSVYIPKKDLEQTNESLDGNFEGIGVEFYIVQDTITVVSAISGGPSELVGIHAGDKIIKIEDTIVAGKKIKNEDVVHKLRGVGGTKVHVSILRSGSPELKKFTIIRDKIPLYSIDAGYMIDATTGYIKINRFSATTHKEFKHKLKELKDQGLKSLIIDLRDNPGGYLDAATQIADELLDDNKLIVFTKGKSVSKVEYKANIPGEFENGKLCILINQGSASAAEILSGAVQDWDRGTIIGRTSFGKGLVQEQYELPDGSALRLTVARYYTPSGRCIQRSYDKGSEAYYNEVYDRLSKGEFMHEDSSMIRDTTVYRTSKGRIVYGGGGIRPDVFVPLDTTEDYDYLYKVRIFIREFVYKQYSAQPDMLNGYKSLADFGTHYTVPATMSAAFKDMLKDDKFVIDEKRYAKVENKINQEIKAYLAEQKWRTDGFYYILNEDDKVVGKALQVIAKK
jgi:carboxyl-terminal processing protease